MSLVDVRRRQRVHETESAAVLLGVDHPLVRTLRRLATVSEQGAVIAGVAGAVFIGDAASENSPRATPRFRIATSHCWCATRKRSTRLRISGGSASTSPARAPHRQTWSGVRANCKYGLK